MSPFACFTIESGIVSLSVYAAPAAASAQPGHESTSASGEGTPGAFFPMQMPLTALNALPVGKLPAGTHQLHILCGLHTACAPRPHCTIQLHRRNLSAHASLEIAKGVYEAYSPAASCVRIAPADESPLVKEIATEIRLEHRSAFGGLLPANTSSPMGLAAVYGLYTVLVAGKAAAWRLARAARCWVYGMGWALAVRVVYAP